MKSKAIAVQSILEMTENRAKVCQVLGHSPSSHEQYRGYREAFRLTMECRVSTVFPRPRDGSVSLPQPLPAGIHFPDSSMVGSEIRPHLAILTLLFPYSH